ncbi:hypothetical protein BFW01_g3807 [Lasiodiplodia theobromae]|uniref:Uncharacterized protein n=2 Tax=Lasiodiplodia TaxID=66739 RepID=A0A5N5DBZ5_9PEZI|nr:putative short-chain dehydrogenase [Lasiodiplodia theobromae]KAB2575231.1 hypothetical protein DBV05_g6151 [Lasiodiplodia theobromae]KAF4541991.1 putative short-chain dehydrogenase [Lasiodiplodia theobromae]KAF9632944.1 hypothetical protein BFW01_g3807 [Lasiodiplodia theobromae]KAK0637996.1 hypothetical protein DIS24_g10267 [Lasiodiplodia hormozganensis]
MKFSLAAILFAAGIHAAALQPRVDPGCPADMPHQVSTQIYLCCAYIVDPDQCCDRDGDKGRGFKACPETTE